MKILRENRGATAIEFALVILPVLFFIFGIIQTAWIVWADNLLQVSVDTAARCGALPNSTTSPCFGPTVANMINTANQVFSPLTGATFSANEATCAASGGKGLVGTYNITLLFVNMTVTTTSCYPTVPIPS